jgi:hypothetical protein
MAVEITAARIAESVREGFKRVERFRKARAFHIKAYVGDYWNKTHGTTGENPINLVFLAIRSLVPALVQQEGVNEVLTKILAQRDFAEKLGLALDDLQTQLHLSRIYRTAIVDMAVGGLTTIKTSIAQSGQLFTVADDLDVDGTQIYSERIDLDDLTVDPTCRAFDKAAFLGHRIRIERTKLLEADGFKRDLVMRLPQAGLKRTERAEDLSKDGNQGAAMADLQDFVNVVELWVPEADSVCYIPDPEEATFSDFLKVEEYYGPETGLYTFGAITQPVPNNPFPIAPVGVWRDLADMANRLFKKAMNQADRQKNITLYRPANIDTAEALRDAQDGEMLPCDDPDGIGVKSYEGPSAETVGMVNGLYGWFNLVAGNPDLMSGAGINAEKATGQQILQQNAAIGVSDMRDMVYDLAAEVSGKQAWFLYNDDLMFQPGLPGIPLIKRLPDGREKQLFLTPSDRSGPFETLGFKIVRRSMSVVDPMVRVQRVTNFTQNIVPQAFMSLQVAMQAGQPFNIPRYLTRVAEDLGIVEIVDDIFNDPDFRTRMEWYANMGAGKGQSSKVGGSNTTQNGGFPIGRAPAQTPAQDFNQNAQATAAVGQSAAAAGGM